MNMCAPVSAMLVLFVACGPSPGQVSAQAPSAAPPSAQQVSTLDQLLAPVALYPDQLLSQILLSASDPAKVAELDRWLKANEKLKGTQVQNGALKAGFEPSL